MIKYQSCLIVILLAWVGAHPAMAAFQVLSWDLRTSVQDFSGSSSLLDFRRNTTPINPFVGSLPSALGQNLAQSTHDYSWLMSETAATFNTSLSQTFRSREIRAVCTAVIRFQTTEEAVFNIDSSMFFSHTPGDEFTVDWNVRLFNLTASNTLFNHFFEGGFGQSEPSSGTFLVNETRVLPANSLFQFSYTLDSTNIGDLIPTGIMDVGGHVNWNVVPEPATLLLFAAALPLLRRLHR